MTRRTQLALTALPLGLLLMVGCAALQRRTTPTSSPQPGATVLMSTDSPAPTDVATDAGPSASPTASPTAPPRPTPPAGGTRAETWDSPVDGMRLMFVPEGSFHMGAAADFALAEPDERPQREVTLQDYWIDSTEVTLEMYANCVEGGGCMPATAPANEPTPGDHPVTGVTWEQADAYCRWVGRRLPTEAEWEKAARGRDRRRYPWGWIGAPETGREPRLNLCDARCPFDYRDETLDDGYSRTSPVGQFPSGVSPYGALDMAGNVWEWVSDWYAHDYYDIAPGHSPVGPPDGSVRSIRGSSWAETTFEGLALTARASNRFWHPPDGVRPDLGFRCAFSR